MASKASTKDPTGAKIMRCGNLKSLVTLSIILAFVSIPACAIKFTAGSGGGSGLASVSGEYVLQDSVSLDSDITLGKGTVSRESSASGTGNNQISESASGEGKSIKNTIISDGAFSSSNSDFASGEGAASNYKASLAGDSGSISTVSSGKDNEMTVAGGFSGEGNMDVSLNSLAAQEALTTGTASAAGTPIFSDELVQGIRGKDLSVSVQGLYLAGEKGLGEFGLVAQNAKGVGAAKPTPTPVDYKLTGWMWQNRNPILLSTNLVSPNIVSNLGGKTVSEEISGAQGTWNGVTSKVLFSLLGTGTSDNDLLHWDTSDGKNVHQWSKFEPTSNTIAMTVTWYTRTKNVLGADGKRYSEAMESDCWYNNNFYWRIDTDGEGKESSFDIRTIATHELGHTLGLADLYEDKYKDQTMYGYNDGTADWELASGDIAGVQKLYGA